MAIQSKTTFASPEDFAKRFDGRCVVRVDRLQVGLEYGVSTAAEDLADVSARPTLRMGNVALTKANIRVAYTDHALDKPHNYQLALSLENFGRNISGWSIRKRSKEGTKEGRKEKKRKKAKKRGRGAGGAKEMEEEKDNCT